MSGDGRSSRTSTRTRPPPTAESCGGKKINLIQRDDNLSAQVAVSALQEMISKFDIKGVIFAGLLDDIYACKRLVQQ